MVKKLNKQIFKIIAIFSLIIMAIPSCSSEETATDWISPTFHKTDYYADTVELVVYSIYDWEFSCDEDWIVPSQMSGSPITPDTIPIYILQNRDRDERSGILQLNFIGVSTSPRELSVTQEGIGNVITVPETFDFTYLADNYSVEVESNIDFQVQYKPDFISNLKFEETAFDEDALFTSYDLTFDAEENVTKYFRRDSIVFVGTSLTDVTSTIYINQDPQSSRQTDSLSLVNFFNGANGADWIKKWDTSKPLTEWEGVLLDSVEISSGKEFRVVALSLPDNNIGGDIDCPIVDITFLKYLWLENNNLSGTIPANILELEFLETLRIGENENIEGTLNSNISKLSNLAFLSIYKTKLNGTIPEELGNLEELSFVQLNDNNLSGTLPLNLGKNTAIKTLILKNNYFEGVIPSSYFSNINWFDWNPDSYICPQKGTGFTNCDLWN